MNAPQSSDHNIISSLSVSTKEGHVEVDEQGYVDMYVSYGNRGTADSEHARRTPRQWMDLLRASVAKQPIGTFCCPICGYDELSHQSGVSGQYLALLFNARAVVRSVQILRNRNRRREVNGEAEHP